MRCESDHIVVPVPGPSAFVSLISAAGRIGKAFTFEGFLSPKKGRRTKRIEALVSRGDTFIIYESPFRVLKTMEELKSFPQISRLVVGRELTKAHEEISVGKPDEIYADYSSRPAIKGEFVILCVMGDDCDNDKED